MSTAVLTYDALIGGGILVAAVSMTAGYILGRIHGEEESLPR